MSIPLPILELLRQRGITEEQEIQSFLYPKLSKLKKPQLMKNLPEAATLVIDYLRSKLPIIVYGDYDVDGVTGTALLVSFLRNLGGNCLWYVPHRFEDGYGLNIRPFLEQEQFRRLDKYLVVTVDCGISDSLAVSQLQELGAEVIITDHHALPGSGTLPECLVVNPSQTDCGFHQEQLAGVGISFYLAAAIRAQGLEIPELKSNCPDSLKDYLALVALGTIADLSHLSPTNRILVRAGLEALRDTSRPGIQALLKLSGIEGGPITSEDIGFQLAPRINAAGRVATASKAVDLLLANESHNAEMLASELEYLNEERRGLTDKDFHACVEIIETGKQVGDACLVVAGEFHPGIAGIVASRLVERYRRPTVVLCRHPRQREDKLFVGSARSVLGLNLIDELHGCAKLLVKYGGHAMAAGLTIELDKIASLRSLLNVSISQKMPFATEASSQKGLSCSVADFMVDELSKYYALLEPFGPGNEHPVFFDNDAQVVDVTRVGRDGDHLSLLLRGKFSNYRGIAFNSGEKYDDIQRNRRRKITYAPTLNRYRGTVSWQLRVVSI